MGDYLSVDHLSVDDLSGGDISVDDLPARRLLSLSLCSAGIVCGSTFSRGVWPGWMLLGEPIRSTLLQRGRLHTVHDLSLNSTLAIVHPLG